MFGSRRSGRSVEGPSVVIIGAGFAGIGAAVRLRQAGFRRVTILDKADGIGGTWHVNRYPGAEVDTPSIIYSYSWMPWNWSRTHVGHAELRAYLKAVVHRCDLEDHIRLGVTVDRVEWDDNLQEWVIYSGSEVVERATHVISAVGLLSDPKFPDWADPDDFDGPVFHTAKWDHSVELAGKRVAVVGSGSSAVQVVPAIATVAADVRMFQREPGWVVPKSARSFTPAERKALESSFAQRVMRLKILMQRERAQFGGALWRAGTRHHTAAQQIAQNFIDSALAGRPDLIELVQPKYPFASKRAIVCDEFYPALRRENVTLVPCAVKGLTRRGLIDRDGVEYECDVIVLATGFKADFLSTFDVITRGGRSVHDIWDGDETAFLGIMVPDVPNFYIMYGPNTNGGNIVSNLELQASYIASAIKHTWRRGASTIEVRPGAMGIYDTILQDRLSDTVFQYENNYYRSGSGRIATQWPDGLLLYAALTKLLRRECWRLGFAIGRSDR